MCVEQDSRRVGLSNVDSRDDLRVQQKAKRKPWPVALLVICDVLLIGAALCVFALFHHVLPQAYARNVSAASAYVAGMGAGDAGSLATSPSQSRATASAASDEATGEDLSEASGSGVSATAIAGTVASTSTPAAESAELGGGKFADRFTDGKTITTANSYASKNVSVTLTKTQKDGATYYIEDIYIRNTENLRSAFAQNTYGRSITDWVPDMAQANGAIAAINGDFYGIGSVGVVIRNGTLYSDRVDGDVCVLFRDGTMKVYAAAEFNAQDVMAKGAYQAWSFGPSLLSADGKALSSFRSNVSGVNPRTAIGYYEPGHYCFVVVDGRQGDYSDGMTLAELSTLFEELGCKVAYNLDGGKSSVMTFAGSIANQPWNGGRETSDIIYIAD